MLLGFVRGRSSDAWWEALTEGPVEQAEREDGKDMTSGPTSPIQRGVRIYCSSESASVQPHVCYT